MASMHNCFWVAAHDDHGDDEDEGCAILYDGQGTVDHNLEEFLLGFIINGHSFHTWHESKQGHWVSLFLEMEILSNGGQAVSLTKVTVFE